MAGLSAISPVVCIALLQGLPATIPARFQRMSKEAACPTLRACVEAGPARRQVKRMDGYLLLFKCNAIVRLKYFRRR
jgi:hypothetical protein